MIPQYITINTENHQYKNYNIYIFCVYLTLNFTFHSQYQHQGHKNPQWITYFQSQYLHAGPLNPKWISHFAIFA